MNLLLALSLLNFKTWLLDIVVTIIICIVVYLLAKHFFKGELSKVITSVVVSGFLYFVAKNPEKILDGLSGYYVIIMTVVKSLIKSRVLVLLQKIKTLKNINLCVV